MIHVFLLLLLFYISIPFPPFHEITKNFNSSKIATDISWIDWEGDVVVAVERIGRIGRYHHCHYRHRHDAKLGTYTLLYHLQTDRFRKDRIWSVLCVCTLSRCTAGFDFENLGNIEFFVFR